MDRLATVWDLGFTVGCACTPLTDYTGEPLAGYPYSYGCTVEGWDPEGQTVYVRHPACSPGVLRAYPLRLVRLGEG